MQKSHKELFNKYRDDGVILRSTEYSRWTVASLMADTFERQGIGQIQQEVARDFQGTGALLVNNLAAKLAALLFPSSRPFFRISLSEELQEQISELGIEDNEVSSELARLEMEACQRIFQNASYNQLVIALKHLIVTGNVLLHRDSASKKTTTYGLQNFVTLRDGRGTMLDCVLREHITIGELNPEFQEQIRLAHPTKFQNPNTVYDPLELYTRIQRVPRGDTHVYVVSQQVEGVNVGEPGEYPEHTCPWQAPTWNLIAGENYGRGLVEDYAGDFAKLSELSEALALYEIEAMKVVNLVEPGSGTDVDELARATSGEWVVGSPATVNYHETGAAEKIQAIQGDLEQLFGRLARAFMYTANTREGERVTAYEIRRDAIEAENVLGGVYSSLAEGMQAPMAPVLVLEVNKGALAGILTEEIKLDIMAGIPALGRAVDVQNLLAAAQELSAIVPILSEVDPRIDISKLADLVYSGRSVDTSILFKSDEQMREEAEADEARRLAEQQMAGAEVAAQQQQALNDLQIE